MNIVIKEIQLNQIDIIKGLWEQLNALHLEDSRFFKDHYSNFTFEQRSKNFAKKNRYNILINVIYNNETPIGYCICTKIKGTGEIDSLFIEDQYRRSGYGRILVKKSLEWFKQHNCNQVEVSVAEGHESVLKFYQKFEFYPRKTILSLRETL